MILPDGTGLDVVERPNNNVVTKAIPKVAMTAIDSKRIQSVALNSGFDDYLVKPIRRSDFLMTAAHYIDLGQIVHS